MSSSKRNLPFDQAVHAEARSMRDAGQEDFSTQLIGACRAIKAGDVSDVSGAIAELTAADIATNVFPNIPEKAVILSEVKKVLHRIAGNIPATTAPAGPVSIADTLS